MSSQHYAQQQQQQQQVVRQLQAERDFSTTVEAVMEKMRLSHTEDAFLLPQLLHWVKTQRPNYMYTTVLSLAVLLQRLARAFSMRSVAPPPKKKAAIVAATTVGDVSTTTTAAAASSGVDPPGAPSLSQAAEPPPPGSASATPVVAAIQPKPTSTSTTAKPKKRKPFRSAKKLDLSPRVVESLKGFVADLAAAIPLILKHAEYEQRLNPQKPGIFVPQRAPTAVDIVDVCLELLEGCVTVMNHETLGSHNNNNNNKPPNAAMELFRTVLAKTTSHNNNNNKTPQQQPKTEEPVSPMDQLKFKTFCVKTLESSQSRTVHLVESFYDFRLMWNICHDQHSMVFVPRYAQEHHANNNNSHQYAIVNVTAPPNNHNNNDSSSRHANSILQEELAWKMTTWRVAKRQEEHPALCTRRQWLVAGAASLAILGLFPFFHRHPQAAAPAGKTVAATTTATATSSSSDKVNSNNKRPMTTTETTSTDPATSASSTPADAAGAAKKIRSSADSVIHNMADTAKSGAKAAKEKETKIVPGFPHGSCDKCAKQERTRHIVMHAARQAVAFLQWASINSAATADASASSPNLKGDNGKSPTEADLMPAEMEQELLQMARDLADFSTVPTLESDSWIDILKAAIQMKDSDEGGDDKDENSSTAEANLLHIIDKALVALKKDDDERLGTRVEAVSYVDENSLISQASRDSIDYLCQATTDRQKKRNELIACIPETSVPTPRRLDEIKQQQQMLIKQQQGGSGDPSQVSTGYQAGTNALVDQNRADSPPVMTEEMELNEWTIAVLSSLSAIGPSSMLVQQLNNIIISCSTKSIDGAAMTTSWQNVIVPVLNRFIVRMHDTVGDGQKQSSLPIEVSADGVARSTYRTQDTQLWAAIIQVFYQALELILTHEEHAANSTLVLTSDFHEALLACCYLSVAKGVIMTGKMQLVNPESHQIYAIMPLTGCTPFTYLKVTESFVRAMTVTTNGKVNSSTKNLLGAFGALPRLLQKEVKTSEIFVIESLLWARDHPNSLAEGYIVSAVADLKQEKQWPPDCLKPTLPEEIEDLDGESGMEENTAQSKNKEAAFVSYLMRKLMKIAHNRIHSICKMLEIPPEYPVVSQAWVAFRYLLRNHIELLYGRHIGKPCG